MGVVINIKTKEIIAQSEPPNEEKIKYYLNVIAKNYTLKKILQELKKNPAAMALKFGNLEGVDYAVTIQICQTLPPKN